VQFAAPRTRMSQVRSRALHQSTNSHKTAKQLAEAKIAKSRPNTLKSCSRWYGPVVDRLFPRHADKWKNIPTAHVGCSPGLHIGHSDLYPSLNPRQRTLHRLACPSHFVVDHNLFVKSLAAGTVQHQHQSAGTSRTTSGFSVTPEVEAPRPFCGMRACSRMPRIDAPTTSSEWVQAGTAQRNLYGRHPCRSQLPTIAVNLGSDGPLHASPRLHSPGSPRAT